MKLKVWETALIAALAFTVLCGAALNRQANELSEKLIRLHVVANSDSEEDQNLKLKVRDTILAYLETELSGVKTSADARKIIEVQIPELAAAAECTVRDNGYDYKITVKICEENFPTTEYDTFSLPAGIYTSLRIIIGEGEGHNWWCVVFPPVCAAATIDETTVAAIGLTDEEVDLITEDSDEYVVKFRLMEIFGKLRSVFN